MKFLVLLSIVGAVVAKPGLLGYSGYSPYTYGLAGLTSQQYHAQDELGQYSYGYSGGPSSKHEARTLDGITRGGYSYIDGNGLVQSVSYVSDPLNGFRVAATNLPQGPAPVSAVAAPVHVAAPVVAAGVPIGVGETPEVIAAKAAHFQAHAEARYRGKRSPGFAYNVSPYAHQIASYVNHLPLSYAASPVVSYSAPVVHSAPAVVAGATTSQYHAQDELGQYSYGYAGGPSAKHETRTLDGITRGGYSYIDGHGLVQTVKYVADPINGFRAAGTNFV